MEKAVNKFEIEWQAPEFEYREKDISWYWISIIIAIIILSAAVWQKNFLFVFFIVVAEILVLVWGGRKPRIVSFKFDDKGLTMDGRKFYPYSAIGTFWLGESADDDWLELALRFKHGIRTWLKIKIPVKRAPEIDKILTGYAEKIEPEMSFLDSLEKLLGF